MVVLLKSLCILPLLFVVGCATPFFFGGQDPFKFDPFKGFFGGREEGGENNGGDNFFKGFFGGYGNAGGGDGGGDTGNDTPPPPPKSGLENKYIGGWELVSQNSRVSAMHLILLPKNNKAIMFDATVFGPSQIALARGNCRPIPGVKKEKDCWAHAVEYDLDTAATRPLKVLTDTWCSSGGLAADGTLVNTGGWNDGGRAVRYLSPCQNCDWREHPTALSGQRWYATQQILPDGSLIVVGGRRMFSYEYVRKEGVENPENYKLPFLRETTDDVENNLYPFVHLSTDGNLFILANNRSILLNTITNKIVRELPVLPGGSRNYPASGMSALLPIKLADENPAVIPAEVIVCGGAKPEAGRLAEKDIFLKALQDCARLQITDPKSNWESETMPTPRVMGDMLILPTGDLLMINGAKKGVSGWQFADDPNLTPMLYEPGKPKDERFTELKPSTIPRMYHSSSAVLPDGKILVAGSNTNNGYNFTGVKFPTDLRVEKFWPPYLDPLLAVHRPVIAEDSTPEKIKYGQNFEIQITLKLSELDKSKLEVTMYAPPFTTHGYSMNQRLLILETREVVEVEGGTYQIPALAPPTSVVAPPGYYIVFVVHRGVPSRGVWVHIQ